MKMKITASAMAVFLVLAVQAQIQLPVIPPGKIAVFKAGTTNGVYPMNTARVAPTFVQVFDPAITNQSSTNALVTVAMSITNNVPGSVWVNPHAGSEGGGISRTVDRRYLALEGYTGNILSPTAAKPSTDYTVTRGIVRLDPFTNAVSVYSDLANWFGIPAGSAVGTQDNPTGIASTDGTNYWGTGNYAPIGANSGELDGTLFLNSIQGPPPSEVQNYLQAAAEARVIGGTLYVVVPKTGVVNFVNPDSGAVVPLPYDPSVPNPYERPAFTNMFINWGSTYKTIANFDMDPSGTVAYGADQTFGIIKFTNNAGTWVQAPYTFNSTNLGTTAQATANQGCFGICVDFSYTTTNYPVIYATTMENGAVTNYPGGLGVNTTQGHQNNNRLIKIVDTGVAPGMNLVAQTLAVAYTTNEYFGGIDFTPDLRPLITSNPVNYATTNGGSAPFSVAAQSDYPLSYQWLQNGTNLNGATSSLLALNNLDTTYSNFTYQCVVTNNYGAVTSTPAILIVTLTAVAPKITSGTNSINSYINGGITFPAVSATGTEPFSYQWYYNGTNELADGANPNGDGSGYSGSQTPSLTLTSLQPTDAGNYYLVITNQAGYASNLVDVLSVNYHLGIISAGQPQSVSTFVGVPTSLTATESGATAPVSYQWYLGNQMLTDAGDYSGSATTTLSIAATTTNDAGTNYYMVVSNPGGSVTSSVASVAILVPPPLSSVNYSNQLYMQTFDSLPDPGGVSANSINNPEYPGTVGGVAYSLANPFDFTYPVILSSYAGGLGLPTMNGWYGSADTNYSGVSGLTRFGAQDGDQSTGGIIDFGVNDVSGGIVGTNRSLGLISTSTTGATTIGLKLTNSSGIALNYINVSFLGAMWRQGNATGQRTMSFGYSFDNTTTNFVLSSASISNSTLVPALAFSFPVGSVAQAVDGTSPLNQTNLSQTNILLSSSWQPGASLWLIWSIDFNGQGSGNGYSIDNLAFSATPSSLVFTAPSVSESGASNISITNAMLRFTINPNNGTTIYSVYYGTNGSSYTSTGISGNLAAGSSGVTITNFFTGLLPGTVYHYQVVAQNFAGTSVTADDSFQTPAGPLVVTTTAALAIGTTSATINGTVNPEGAAALYYFNYGATTSYGNSTTPINLPAGVSTVSVSNLITGLLPGTTNHYQIVAANFTGTVTGADISFITASGSPLATTLAATNIFASAARLVGSVNPSNAVTAYWFVYGTSPTLSAANNLTPTVSLSATNGTATVTNTSVITGLLPGTQYYYQIVATNFAGTSSGSISNFTTSNVLSAPIVTTLAAANILATTAKLSATVNPTNDAATYWFAYGTNSSTLTNLTAQAFLAATNFPAAVTNSPVGLLPGTQYFYQIVAFNSYGTSMGGVSNFTTATVSVPVVATLAATNIVASGARLNATVNPNYGVTTYWFIYGTSPTLSAATNTPSTFLATSNNTAAAVSSVLSGLSQGTTYYYQIAATNIAGTAASGSISNFTTPAVSAPVVATLSPATKINASGATVAGSVLTNTDTTIYWFNFGTNNSTAFTNITTPAVLSGTTNITGLVTNTAALTGLLPGTTYSFQIVATNIAGMSLGVTNTFTTTNPVPVVVPLEAQNITPSGAMAGAIVNPNNATTGYWFKYGTNTVTGLNSLTATNVLAAGYGPVVSTKSISGLSPNTVYYFQVVATNVGGTTTSWNTTFTTAAITPPQLVGVTLSGGKLQFNFTSATGVSFSIRATNNVAAPVAIWPVIGLAVENPPGTGNYRFTDPNAATNSSVFYILSQP